MGLSEKTDRSSGRRFCDICEPLGLDITGQDYSNQPRSNWKRRGEQIYGREDDDRDDKTSAMRKTVKSARRLRKWHTVSGAPLIADIKTSADAGCTVCKLVDELVEEALPKELEELREYAKIKVRRSFAKSHQSGLFLVLSGRFRMGLRLSDISMMDNILMKAMVSMPWKPYEVPMELYCAAGRQRCDVSTSKCLY